MQYFFSICTDPTHFMPAPGKRGNFLLAFSYILLYIYESLLQINSFDTDRRTDRLQRPAAPVYYEVSSKTHQRCVLWDFRK